MARRWLLAWLTPLLALAWMGAAVAAEFEEGTDYSRLSSEQPTSVTGKVEVRELFWYGCPHCYDLEPKVHAWNEEKAPYIEMVRMPAIFKNQEGHPWRVSAAAYYTAEALGVLDKVHTPMFDAIHANDRKLFTEEALADFFAEHGVDPETFRKTFQSFAVQTQANRAAEMTRRYRIPGVPALIVNGRYRVSASQAGNFDRMLRIVDELAAREAARMGIE